MVKIEDNYIREALRIMNTYDKELKNLEKYSAYVEDLKNSVDAMHKKIDALVMDKSPEMKKNSELYTMIRDHEIELLKKEAEVKPFLDAIEQLRKDSLVLYTILKEKHPGVTDNEFKMAIINQIPDFIRDGK